MPRIKVDERKIYVEEYGRGNTRAIVFFHGGPGAGCAGFADQARALGKKYHVVLFDQFGAMRAGAIAKEEPFGMMEHVRLIDRMREVLGIHSWAVLGHSYGGMLACLYAHTYSERTDAAIYECTSWDLGLFSQAMASHFLPYFQEIHSEEGLQSCGRILGGDPADRAQLHDELRSVLMPLVKAPRNVGHKTAVHCRKLREAGEVYRCFLPYLDEIDRPSLLLLGKHDPTCGAYERDYFLRHAPKGAIIEFQNSGHFPHLEEPDAYTEAIMTFLDGI